MDHIKNNLDKYSEYKSKSTELDSIRKVNQTLYREKYRLIFM